MKKHHIKKETVFHHISHTVERKISTEIFSTNFKVFDIVMRQQDSLRRRDSPRGVSLGVLGGDVPPCSPNPGPILDQNMLFCCISRKYIIITQIRTLTKNFLKSISNPRACFSFFLTHLEFKRQIPSYTPLVRLKTMHYSRKTGLYPFSGRKGPHTLWGSTDLSDLYKGDYQPTNYRFID